MERDIQRDDEERELRLQILRAQAEELEERARLHRKMRQFYDTAEKKLATVPNVTAVPAFHPFFNDGGFQAFGPQ